MKVKLDPACKPLMPSPQFDKKHVVATMGGKLVDLQNPRVEDIHTEDICIALAQSTRFNGVTKAPWSIAKHSLLVADLCDPEYMLEALLHDATEAYLGDLATGVKQLCPDYQKLEANFDKIIRQKYKLPAKCSPQVKEADRMALIAEMYFLTNIKLTQNPDRQLLQVTAPFFRPSKLTLKDEAMIFLHEITKVI